MHMSMAEIDDRSNTSFDFDRGNIQTSLAGITPFVGDQSRYRDFQKVVER